MKKLLYLFIAIFSKISCFSEELKKDYIYIETTIPYLKDLVLKASCNSNKFKVDSIIPTGSDPHSFHMSPSNRISLAKADIIFSIGAGFEPWVSKIQKSKNQQWVNITANMLLKKLDSKEMDSHTHNHSEHDEYLEYDPHIWQSPSLTKQALINISKILKKHAPNEDKKIEICTQEYINKIDQIVIDLKKKVSVIPTNERIIATNHDALGYFASEFGFQIYNILGLSDASAPTAEHLKKIILKVKKEKIPAVFLESTGNMGSIKTVSKETGVKIGGTLYSDSLGPKGSGAETAPDMWNANLDTIINALKK